MAKGLAAQWGVDSPGSASEGSTRQRNAFMVAFKGSMHGLGGSLNYTAENTEQAKHSPLAGGRDGLYGKYQQVLGQIDPTNESSAAGAIAGLLDALRSLVRKAEEIKQQTISDLDEWNGCGGEREEANNQIEELDVWGIEKIAEFLADRGLIDAEEAERRWKEATALLRKLRDSLAPVYEEYLRQKDAKERYEPEREGFDSEFEPLADHPEATDEIKDGAKQIGEGLTEIDSKVEEKDFVAGGGLLSGLGGLLERVKQLVEQQEAAKAEYDARSPGVLDRDFEAPESKNGTPGWQLQMDIVNLEENMKAAAEEKNYEGALELLDQLEKKTSEAKAYFEELAAKKLAYEARKDQLLTRATEASADLPERLGPNYQEVDQLFPLADKAADNERYDEADAVLDELARELDAFVVLIEQHRQEKADFEAQWPPLLDEVTQTVLATPPEAERALEDLNAVVEQISQAETAEDYGEALRLFGPLRDEHQKLVLLLELQRAYQAKLDELLPRVTAASEDLPKHLEPLFQVVDSLLGQGGQTADDLQYEAALGLLKGMETALVAFEQRLEQHRQEKETFEAQWPPLLDEVTQSVLATPPELERALADLNAVVEQISQAETAEDYGEALRLFGPLRDEHRKLVQILEKHKADKAAFEDRQGQVEDELEKVKEDVPSSLQEEKGQVERSKSEADRAGKESDFDQGQAKLDETKQEAQDLDAKVKEHEARKKEYEEDHKALEDRLASIGYPADFLLLKESAVSIDKRKGEAEAAAGAEDYVTALDALTRAAAMVEGYAEELPVYQKQEADYLAKSPPVKQQVQTAGKDLPRDDSAKALYEGLQKAVALMETSAGGRDFAEALTTLTQIETGLTTLASFVEKEKQKEEEYNQRAGTLEDPLAEAIDTPEKNEDLKALQQRMSKRRIAMKEAAGLKDFDKALDEISELEAVLEGYQSQKADVEAERKTYTTRLAAVTEQLATTQPPIPGDMAKSILAAIGRNKATMEGFAAKDDFDQALEAMDSIDTSLAAYGKLRAEHEKLKSEYDSRASALAPGLAEVAEPVSHIALKTPRSKIFGKQEAMQQAAGQQDYAAAIAALDWLEPAVADYLSLQEAMENAEEEYDKRYDPLKPRLDEAADPADYPEAEEPQGSIASGRSAMEQSAGNEDFETALGQIVVLGADVTAYEALLERLRQHEEDFTARWTALKGPLDNALKTEEKNNDLKGIQERLKPRRDKVEEAERDRAFEAGLGDLTELEAAFEGFNAHKADVEEERRTYQKRAAALNEALKKTQPPLEGEMAAKILAAIGRNRATMEAAAEQDDFDEALLTMDTIDTSLAAYDDLLEQEEDLEERYIKGAAALRAKLGKLAFPPKYPILKPVAQSIETRMGEMEAAAGQDKFEEAIDKMNRADAMLDGYAKELIVLQKQEANYKARHGAIKPRLKAVAQARPSDPKAQAMLKGITRGYKAMKDLAAKDEYKEALSYMTQLEGTLATLETFLAEAEA